MQKADETTKKFFFEASNQSKKEDAIKKIESAIIRSKNTKNFKQLNDDAVNKKNAIKIIQSALMGNKSRKELKTKKQFKEMNKMLASIGKKKLEEKDILPDVITGNFTPLESLKEYVKYIEETEKEIKMVTETFQKYSDYITDFEKTKSFEAKQKVYELNNILDEKIEILDLNINDIDMNMMMY